MPPAAEKRDVTVLGKRPLSWCLKADTKNRAALVVKKLQTSKKPPDLAKDAKQLKPSCTVFNTFLLLAEGVDFQKYAVRISAVSWCLV